MLTSRADSYIQFITVLILFVFVLFITYAVTRWIAKYQKGRTIAGNIEILETCRLTSNKYIQIVRTGNKYLVIAVGKDEVHMLTELSKEELLVSEAADGKVMDFAGIFDKVKRLKEKEKD